MGWCLTQDVFYFLSFSLKCIDLEDTKILDELCWDVEKLKLDFFPAHLRLLD